MDLTLEQYRGISREELESKLKEELKLMIGKERFERRFTGSKSDPRFHTGNCSKLAALISSYYSCPDMYLVAEIMFFINLLEIVHARLRYYATMGSGDPHYFHGQFALYLI